MNQTERILRHLQDHGSITQAEAFSEYGIMRLASRVNNLRRTGHKITTERVETVNRYGEKVHYGRYKLNRI